MFICFEGIDGSGKTTQAKLMRDRLVAENIPVELIVDPGTTKLGKAVRQILLESDTPICPASQMLLFSAARAELTGYIKERLAAGVVIIADRWLLSTLIYQGFVNKIPTGLIWGIFNETVGVQPDLYFLLDIDPKLAATRLAARVQGNPGPKIKDRYESWDPDAISRMRDEYLAASRAYQNVHAVVYSEDSPVDVIHEWAYAQFIDKKTSMEAGA